MKKTSLFPILTCAIAIFFSLAISLNSQQISDDGTVIVSSTGELHLNGINRLADALQDYQTALEDAGEGWDLLFPGVPSTTIAGAGNWEFFGEISGINVQATFGYLDETGGIGSVICDSNGTIENKYRNAYVTVDNICDYLNNSKNPISPGARQNALDFLDELFAAQMNWLGQDYLASLAMQDMANNISDILQAMEKAVADLQKELAQIREDAASTPPTPADANPPDNPGTPNNSNNGEQY